MNAISLDLSGKLPPEEVAVFRLISDVAAHEHVLFFVVGGLLGLLVSLGHSNAWLVLGVTFLVGCGSAFLWPAWQSIQPELVPDVAGHHVLLLDDILDTGQTLAYLVKHLQGFGAASVKVDANAHPAGKLDAWRRKVDCLFGVTLSGALIAGEQMVSEFVVHPPQCVGIVRTVGLRLLGHLRPTQSRVQVASFFRKDVGEIVSGRIVVRINLERLGIILFGLLGLPLPVQGDADLPVHLGRTFSSQRFVHDEFVSGGQ